MPANKTGENWIIDNYGNGYHILSSDVINYKKETQNSYHNKYSVNTGKMNAKGKGVTKTKGNYATAWINHGLAPKNANYQYIIYPFNTESEIDDFEEKENELGQIVLKPRFIPRGKEMGIVEWKQLLKTNRDNVNSENKLKEFLSNDKFNMIDELV